MCLNFDLASVNVFVRAVSGGQTHASAIFGNLQVDAVVHVVGIRLPLLPECVEHGTPRRAV